MSKQIQVDVSNLKEAVEALANGLDKANERIAELELKENGRKTTSSNRRR